MKIAIIGSKGIPAKYGGVQVVVENIANQFVRSGHSVTIYARSYYSDNKAHHYYFNGIEVHNVRGFRSKRLDTLSHSLISSIRAAVINYDIVVFHSIAPAYFAFIPKLFGKITVLHSHGLEVNIAKWNKYDKLISRILRKTTAKYLDLVTTVSIDEVSLTGELYNTKVIYLENGASFKPHKAVLEKDDYLLCVGRIVPGKGIEYLIQSFIELSRSMPTFKLFIVGDSVYADEYMLKLKEMSKNNSSIVWKGVLVGEELIEIYQRAFCVVVPSESESFSLVALEGLFYNGLVICSDTTQFRSLYGDHVQYFTSKSSDSLLRLITKFIHDPAAVRLIRERALQFKYDDYSWDRISEKYIVLYNSLLESTRS